MRQNIQMMNDWIKFEIKNVFIDLYNALYTYNKILLKDLSK